jgi:Ca-activated chloride channel family protein
MREAVCATLVGFALAVGTPGHAAAQASADAVPSARILSPDADSYLTGKVTLLAAADTSAPITAVTFYVDGRQVCSVEQAPYECAWDAGSEVSAHQVRAVFGLSDGGRVARTVRTKGLGFADRVNVEVVHVTATITDDHDRFVAGLPKTAFTILEDGQPQSMTYFSSEDVPLELIVAVDISGSMAPAMPRLKQAVKDFLAAVPAQNQVTLIGFNDSVFPLTRRETNPAERVRAVDRLAPWGATALYDVIIRGTEMLGRQTGRKALVVFSDGEDQGSHVALEDVERRLQASDVTLYMIAQGRGLSQEYLRNTMRRLTVPTGGRTFTTATINDLHTAFDELLDELSHQYLLGYPPTNAVRDDTWREIKVQVDGPWKVRARQGYRAEPYR